MKRTFSPNVIADGYSPRDYQRTTIVSPGLPYTNQDSIVEYADSAERETNGMDDFRSNIQPNIRRDTLLSPSQASPLPENHSETTLQNPLRQSNRYHRDHTELFRETFNDDVSRRSLSYPGFHPGNDRSDDELDTSQGRLYNHSNGTQISDDDDEGNRNGGSAVPSERTAIEHVGDVLYSAVTLFECIPYISVLHNKYDVLETEIKEALEELSRYVSDLLNVYVKVCM